MLGDGRDYGVSFEFSEQPLSESVKMKHFKEEIIKKEEFDLFIEGINI